MLSILTFFANESLGIFNIPSNLPQTTTSSGNPRSNTMHSIELQ